MRAWSERPELVRWRRLLLGPLLFDHALILGGAALLVYGAQRSDLTPELSGIALLVTGIAIEMAVLVWSARLISRARPSEQDDGSHARRRLSLEEKTSLLCPNCGYVGDAGPGRTCHRCYHSMVRRV